MRTFVSALIILGVLIGCAVANNIYLKSVISQMMSLVDSLPTLDDIEKDGFAAEDAVAAPAALWNDNIKKMDFTVNKKHLAAVGLAASSLQKYYKSEESSEYCASVEALYHALDAMQNAEIFSFFGII